MNSSSGSFGDVDSAGTGGGAGGGGRAGGCPAFTTAHMAALSTSQFLPAINGRSPKEPV
jgi:hypothetical protein